MTDNYFSDKKTERQRYENQSSLFLNNSSEKIGYGIESVSYYLRSPYSYYYKQINNNIKSNYKVLEIGSGIGTHTEELLKTKANVYCLDISPASLKVLKKKFTNFNNFQTIVGDIEKLPFNNEEFDAVISAGTLSYGESSKVDKEILRVLKKSGIFMCVDSLNHNPIYKLNRYIHFLKNKRSRMTIKNMPNLKRITELISNFREKNIKYFGSISYLMPFISKIFGEKKALKFSDFIDNLFNVKKSSFKFVLTLKKKNENPIL